MNQGLFATPPQRADLYARVVLERGIDQPEGLTYAVPATLAGLEPGERVRAPLGRGDHPAEGVVIELLSPEQALAGLAAERIKPLLGRVSRSAAQAPRVPPHLVRLALWISQYYCCPIGMVLGTMVPSAVKKQTGAATRRVLDRPPGIDPGAGAIADLTPALRKTWDVLQSASASLTFPIEARTLADHLGCRTVAPINRLVKAGLLVERMLDTVRAGEMLQWKGDPGDAQPRDLTPDQRRALGEIARSLDRFHVHLLLGVTGSGKTEVYLHLLRRVIDGGSSAIVLVPEISLTPQTAGRFLARFAQTPGGVAVLHSGLSASQRHREWARVSKGEARIVVGARSAVFAPFAPGSLGLIIVDEEHDSSYKQDQLPRYHARDVAIRRAQLEGFPVLLGSATPSLESWHNAQPAERGGAGRFGLSVLPRRVGGGALPRVEIVDLMQEERARRQSKPRDGSSSTGSTHYLHALGPTLEAHLDRTLEGGGQAILLLNRRGYANYICCVDATCGWYLTCRHCDVTLVYHRVKGGGEAPSSASTLHLVRCHHCQAEQKLPVTCPVCSKRVNTFGFGTQRLEEELKRKFPRLAAQGAMLRLDSDTMRRASDYFTALEQFRSGAARLLVGTQMIAKGLDFPNVSLIGVVNADTALNMPDFRSEERTFQLLAQVAGRAGRSEATGQTSRVIVQSLSPQTPSIQLAAAHDYEGFADRELAVRRDVGLPPVGRMARIVCRDLDAAKADRRAFEIAQAAQDHPEVRVKGPMPCPIARIGDHYRFAVELLGASAAPIQRVLAALRSAGLVKSDAHTAVDVDPVSLL